MIVVDANVIVSALRSNRGASHAVLRGMLSGEFSFGISPAVILEYEDVVKRPGILGSESQLTLKNIDQVLDAICLKATPALPWFRLRPLLIDPKDDIYVECALAVGANAIVTNDLGLRHPFLDILGIRTTSARDFMIAEGKD